MTDAERAEVAQTIGWLEGFSHSVWLLLQLSGAKGEPIVSDAACAEYDERVGRLWPLVFGGEDGEA